MSQSVNQEIEIYVELTDEAVQVWRHVKAVRISDDVFEIVDQPYDREIEVWAFDPGQRVVCTHQHWDGDDSLVAERLA